MNDFYRFSNFPASFFHLFRTEKSARTCEKCSQGNCSNFVFTLRVNQNFIATSPAVVASIIFFFMHEIFRLDARVVQRFRGCVADFMLVDVYSTVSSQFMWCKYVVTHFSLESRLNVFWVKARAQFFQKWHVHFWATLWCCRNCRCNYGPPTETCTHVWATSLFQTSLEESQKDSLLFQAYDIRVRPDFSLKIESL